MIVGVLADERNGDGQSVDCHDGVEIVPGTNSPFGASRGNQPFAWEDVIAGFYYVSCLFLPSSVWKKVPDVGDAQRSNQTTQAGPRMCVVPPPLFAQFGPDALCLTLPVRRFAMRGL